MNICDLTIEASQSVANLIVLVRNVFAFSARQTFSDSFVIL